ELAKRINLKSRADARSWLDEGKVVVVFPGGTVSTAMTPMGKAYDPAWKPFTARLIARSKAAVLPIYFPGQNSRMFQLASLLHPTLRTALFFHEASNKMRRRIRVEIGQAMTPETLPVDEPVRLIQELRQHTYGLGGLPDAPVAPSQG
ncbi:MAG: acyltransferase, partial [Myxococcota bacterium]